MTTNIEEKGIGLGKVMGAMSVLYIAFFIFFASSDSSFHSKTYLGWTSLAYAVVGLLFALLFLEKSTQFFTKKRSNLDQLILDEEDTPPTTIDKKFDYIANGINILILATFLGINIFGDMIWAAVLELVYALFWSLIFLIGSSKK
ncbi:MAG: hypothetical protein GY810_25355 [Aureispira sp.]|nr:hypothetical protein [Aureispira sp.]